MSAFYLYKKDAALDLSKAEWVFIEAGLDQPKQFDCGEYRIWLYKKESEPVFDIAMEEDATALLVGSMAYRGTRGSSLKNALHDWLSGSLSSENCVGIFALIFLRNNRISIITDGSGIQNLYYDRSCRVVSSSLLAIVQSLPEKLSLNHLAVAENLVTGFVLGPDTIFNEIQRYELTDRASFTFPGVTVGQLILPPISKPEISEQPKMVDYELDRLRNRYSILSEHRIAIP
jgi:hypothetical protein